MQVDMKAMGMAQDGVPKCFVHGFLRGPSSSTISCKDDISKLKVVLAIIPSSESLLAVQ